MIAAPWRPQRPTEVWLRVGAHLCHLQQLFPSVWCAPSTYRAMLRVRRSGIHRAFETGDQTDQEPRKTPATQPQLSDSPWTTLFTLIYLPQTSGAAARVLPRHLGFEFRTTSDTTFCSGARSVPQSARRIPRPSHAGRRPRHHRRRRPPSRDYAQGPPSINLAERPTSTPPSKQVQAAARDRHEPSSRRRPSSTAPSGIPPATCAASAIALSLDNPTLLPVDNPIGFDVTPTSGATHELTLPPR